MISSFVGLLIVLTGQFQEQSVPEELLQDPYISAAVRGGPLNVRVDLTGWPGMGNAFVPASTAFVLIKGLPECISPQNVQVRDGDGGPVQFRIEDGERKGVRRWALRPAGNYPHASVTVDIDFVNKCAVS